MPKCGIDTPKNQYHIFNTMFSIPHFQYLIFNTTCYSSKICCFHEKNRQIEDAFAKSLFWRYFFVKMTKFVLWMNHLATFFALWWFHEKLPILASENTALNSYSKPYDNIKSGLTSYKHRLKLCYKNSGTKFGLFTSNISIFWRFSIISVLTEKLRPVTLKFNDNC